MEIQREELLDKRDRTAAQNPSSEPELLRLLADSKDALTREYVAGNPNAPVDILKELCREFPEAITANPIFKLLILTEANNSFIELSLARSSTTPVGTLEKFSLSEDREILRAIALNRATPIHVLERLVDRLSQFKGRQIGHPLMTQLIIDNSLVRNPSISTIILGKIAIRYSHRIPQVYNLNGSVCRKKVEIVESHIYCHILALIAKNEKTPVDIVEQLAGECSPLVRQAVLRNKKASDAAIDIVRFIEGDSNVPSFIWEKLATDKRTHVRDLVARNPQTSSRACHQLD